MLLILFFMFLAFLNFFKGFYYCIFIAAVLFLFTPNRKLRLNPSVITLLILSISMLVFDPLHQDTLFNMITPFIYPFCYLIGFGLLTREEKAADNLAQEEKCVSSVIYVSAGSTLVYFLLNMVINWETSNRNDVIDFWSRSIIAATAQSALACVAIGVIIALLFSKIGKWKKGLTIVLLVLILIYNLTLAGRTIFALAMITAVAALLYVCIIEKKQMLKTVIIVLAVTLIVGWLYEQNVFGVKSLVESSNFYERFYSGDTTQEIDESGRSEHKLAYLERFTEHFWGGGHIRKAYGHSAHDLYLDTYDESGIIALCAVFAYIIASLVRWVKCIRSKTLSRELRLLIFCTYLVCNIQFWLEPIMRGMPWLFAVYCFMDGAVTYLLIREDELEAGNENTPLLNSEQAKTNPEP